MAITSNVSSFLQVVKQGVRPNMFQVDISFPDTIDADNTLVTYMCKSAVLPASNIGVIEVPFRGRTVKIAGDRTFDNWSATFINDKEMKSRAYFEQWLNEINTHKANTASVIDPLSFTVMDTSPPVPSPRIAHIPFEYPAPPSAIYIVLI